MFEHIRKNFEKITAHRMQIELKKLSKRQKKTKKNCYEFACKTKEIE